MKLVLPFALLACWLHAGTDALASEPTPAQRHARISVTLRSALDDQTITPEQYKQALAWLNARPCAGVDRRLGADTRARLEAAIARQEGRDKVRVFESFKLRGWSALFSNAGDGDEPFYFYASDPVKGARPRAVWAGAATVFETSDIAQWVRQEAPGIPGQLADCFAWHVTLEGRRTD
jgi:hypothetical protein